jgi:hypothetical protein
MVMVDNRKDNKDHGLKVNSSLDHLKHRENYRSSKRMSDDEGEMIMYTIESNQ